MLEELIQATVDFMQKHPSWAGVITFWIALLESLPIFGYLLPGSLVLTGIGLLIGAKILPFNAIVLWAIAGAIVGDGLSYTLGRHYHLGIRNLKIFIRYAGWFDQGQVFFEKHGGKSVFLGRFIGPLRPIIPVIAGMMNMRTHYFLLANVTSAILWAPAHLLPGVVLGAASVAYSPKQVMHFVVNLLLILLITWVVGIALRTVVLKGIYMMNRMTKPLWHWLQAQKGWPRYQGIFYSKNANMMPDHLQLSLLLGAVLFALLFALFTTSVIHAGYVTQFDQEVLTYFAHWQQQWVKSFAILLTFMGDRRVMLLFLAVLAVYSAYKREWYTLSAVLLLAVATIGSVYTLKALLNISRPEGHSFAATVGSYPSGHTTLSVTVYGLIAILARQKMHPDSRWFLYKALLIILTGIILSRLYLGSHWLSDVIGSLFLASSILLTVLFYLRRRPQAQFSPRVFLSLMLITLLLGLGYVLTDYYVWQQHLSPATCKQLAEHVWAGFATSCQQLPEAAG